ncbi:MAG TPA: chromosome segregation protein SMC [Pyrinomonadaceae bacterium]|nr:chromosome segregation protein SMC [Pyrinomonadaceae bacterium]
MFKLQRLEITGFKSFADYTEIVFTGNGITAVVGPNGCGKSNVSDAISWVLGEQRAKSLRGGEMKDVVFQGSRNRKPGGMAEVVLHLVRDTESFDIDENELEDIDETLNTLDENAVDVDALEAETIEEPEPVEVVAEDTVGETNGFHADEFEVEKVQAAQVGSVQTVERTIKTKRHWRPRSFALDFAPGEAIAVTRRLYLSGESEYLLNGKTCRLRDIQDLFAGTGLSGAHYAIIEQGRIGQILSAKPSDRRNLIEEAAGISKFRTRQRAAETRLDSARTNLGRISDIVSEIEKQANSLRRQAGKTRRFLVLQEEFRVLLRQLFAAEGRHLSEAIASFEKGLADAVDVEHAFTAKVAEQEESVREATHHARFVEETLAEIRRRHADNALERDRAEREHRYQAEQIVNLNNRADVVRGEIEATEQRLKLIESELERLHKEDEAESAEADASRLILQEAEKQYQIKLDDVRQIEVDLETHRNELIKHSAAVERFDEIARQLEVNAERLTERLQALEREGVRASETYEAFIQESQDLERDEKLEGEKLETLQGEKTELLAETATAREKLRGSEESLRNLEAEHLKTRNRHDTLAELDENRAVYAPQIQKLFASQEAIGVKISGVLADFFKVEERHETAVESLFGQRLQTVIVESVEDARTVSSWLEQNSIGRIAILAVPTLNNGAMWNPFGSGGSRVENILGVSGGLLATLKEAFPREMSAKVVDAVENADLATGETFVTLGGSVITPAGLFISGRELTDDQPNASLLAFKRELSGLEKTLTALDEQIAVARSIADGDSKDLAALEEKTVDLQSLIIKVERGLHGLDIQRSTTRQEIERAERHKKVVADEQKQTHEEIEQNKMRISEAADSRRSAELYRDGATSEVERINAVLTDARTRSDEENAVVNEKRTLAATSGERRRSVHATLKRVENEQKELEARSALQTVELNEIDVKITALRESTAAIADRIAGAETEKATEIEELTTAIAEVTAARESADAMSAELADLNHRSADALNERAAIEVRQAEAVTELKNVNEKCSQELNTPLSELIESEMFAEDFILDECRIRVDDLRNRLEGFGAINMLAVEELGEAEERLLFLTSQRQDIIDSIASAEEALREIKERSRQRFKQAFEAINANFIEFFQELFGGGKGEMTLLENDDILEAGIEVVAQPPGKRLQNILLLSGGEKAMTAIALVMAIFRYRPSPFCLLDEVDAPLDDANVGRFVTKIASMAEKTQFIVITHNKRTMEAARALYGVTMQEAGVSKIVSVKFE